jgi:signal transduction histidine kinase
MRVDDWPELERAKNLPELPHVLGIDEIGTPRGMYYSLVSRLCYFYELMSRARDDIFDDPNLKEFYNIVMTETAIFNRQLNGLFQSVNGNIYENVSHELRTPIVAIKNFLPQLYASPNLSDRAREDLSSAAVYVDELCREVQKLIEISRELRPREDQSSAYSI